MCPKSRRAFTTFKDSVSTQTTYNVNFRNKTYHICCDFSLLLFLLKFQFFDGNEIFSLFMKFDKNKLVLKKGGETLIVYVTEDESVNDLEIKINLKDIIRDTIHTEKKTMMKQLNIFTKILLEFYEDNMYLFERYQHSTILKATKKMLEAELRNIEELISCNSYFDIRKAFVLHFLCSDFYYYDITN